MGANGAGRLSSIITVRNRIKQSMMKNGYDLIGVGEFDSSNTCIFVIQLQGDLKTIVVMRI